MAIANHSSSKSVCKILLSNSKSAPYSETASGDVLSTFNAAVLGQLLRTNESFELFPGLISEFKFDHTKNAYTLRLRDNLMFHDGSPVTAKDLEFALLRGFFSKNRSFYSIYLNNIKGLDKIPENAEFESGLVEGIKVTDRLTVSVELSAPNPSFLHALTNPYFSVVKRAALNKDNLSWKETPIGAGPYKVSQPFDGSKIKLELSSPHDLNKSESKPNEVWLYTDEDAGGQFDVIGRGLENVDTKNFTKVPNSRPAGVYALFFSSDNPLGRDENFRKGVQYLINRSELLEDLSGQVPTFEILPKHFWGRAQKTEPFDLKKAKFYFDQVPKKLLNQKWKVLTFSPGGMNDTKTKMTEEIEKQFRQVGISIEFEANGDKFLTPETAKESPFRLSGRVSDYVDPLVMLASFRSDTPYHGQKPPGGLSSEFDALYKKASLAKTNKNRLETVQAISNFIFEHSIAVALSESRFTYLVNNSTVSNLGFQPQPLTLFIENIEMKAKN